MADWDKKAKSFNLLPTIHSPWGKGHFQIESEGWEKRFHANGQDRKAGVPILISDKIDFKIKKDKERHYLMVKGSIQKEDITFVNIYAPNIGAPRY